MMTFYGWGIQKVYKVPFTSALSNYHPLPLIVSLKCLTIYKFLLSPFPTNLFDHEFQFLDEPDLPPPSPPASWTYHQDLLS